MRTIMEDSYYKQILDQQVKIGVKQGQFRHLRYYALNENDEKIRFNGQPLFVQFPDTNGKNSDPAQVRPDSAGLYAMRDLLEKVKAYRAENPVSKAKAAPATPQTAPAPKPVDPAPTPPAPKRKIRNRP